MAVVRTRDISQRPDIRLVAVVTWDVDLEFIARLTALVTKFRVNLTRFDEECLCSGVGFLLRTISAQILLIFSKSPLKRIRYPGAYSCHRKQVRLGRTDARR